MVPVAQGTEVYNADSPPVLARGYEYAQSDLDAARTTEIPALLADEEGHEGLADATFLMALEAALNVLPPVGGADFEAQEKLRKLAFTEVISEPEQMTLFVEKAEVVGGADDDGEDED
jgi:hypothetical protein